METIYIRLEKLPKGLNHAPTVGGRSAAKNWEKLNTIARELNIKPLDSFLRTGANGKETWFPPAEALATIGQLISRISSNTRRFEQARQVIRDLNSYENILVSAQARDSKFCFLADQS